MELADTRYEFRLTWEGMTIPDTRHRTSVKEKPQSFLNTCRDKLGKASDQDDDKV